MLCFVCVSTSPSKDVKTKTVVEIYLFKCRKSKLNYLIHTVFCHHRCRNMCKTSCICKIWPRTCKISNSNTSFFTYHLNSTGQVSFAMTLNLIDKSDQCNLTTCRYWWITEGCKARDCKKKSSSYHDVVKVTNT